MRKFIVAVALVLMVAAPIAAVELYDFGGDIVDGASEVWVTPLEARNTFFGIPEFPQPPSFGYQGYISAIHGDPCEGCGDPVYGIHVEMLGMNNIFGDIFTPPPARYGETVFVPWNEEFSAYGWTEVTDKGVEFEFFVLHQTEPDDDGFVRIYGKWVTGCLTASGSLFPPWIENEQCIWSEWDLGEIPEWKVHLRRGSQRRK